MKISSPAFPPGGAIPRMYTCDDKDINPPLVFTDIPAETKSLVLRFHDPDSPNGHFVHWLMYDIPPASEIKEDSVPGRQLGNNFGMASYGGPCPSSGTHRYIFTVWALETDHLPLALGATEEELLRAVDDQSLAVAELVGTYGRS